MAEGTNKIRQQYVLHWVTSPGALTLDIVNIDPTKSIFRATCNDATDDGGYTKIDPTTEPGLTVVSACVASLDLPATYPADALAGINSAKVARKAARIAALQAELAALQAP